MYEQLLLAAIQAEKTARCLAGEALPPLTARLYYGGTIVHLRRGYCLELICADFLAGRTGESSPDEILMVIHGLVKLLPREYLARLRDEDRGRESEAAGKC